MGCSSSKAELYDKVFKLVGEDKTRFSAIKRYLNSHLIFDQFFFDDWFIWGYIWFVISVYCRLGLLSNEIAVPKPSPLDTLSQYLSEKLAFGKICILNWHAV